MEKFQTWPDLEFKRTEARNNIGRNYFVFHVLGFQQFRFDLSKKYIEELRF